MDWQFTQQELAETARLFVENMTGHRVFAFHGDMGAGKTTFIHAVCEVLEVKDTVGSPTYSLINEYVGKNGRIYHIDLYRLRDAEEAVQAGVEDCLYSGDTCFVEWPTRAPELFPEGTLHVHLAVINEETRRIWF